MIDKITAQKRIADLVIRFEDQFASYKNSDYNETQTRRDFIDPFFKALGWDIDNEEGYAEAYREVIHEDKVKVSGATKAPDYSFRLVGGKRLFFVEAKKPSVSVKNDIQPAYQIRRYGWSAKHPISIITDFEEFAIYDCTKKPKPEDKPSVARIKYFTYQDYLKEFDFIWETFSKEQVLKGSFDKFLQSDTHKKGTTSVDKDFLESLDRWRTYLAVNISWNNKNLDEDEINFAVQQTIDRIIFLRIAEDRSVEPYGNLKHAIKQGNLYLNLFEQFRNADEKYNSGLFDIKKDRISETLKIENKIVKTIINELYYPECPYEFSVLPVEILGSAYEQFLGKVIRITPAHHAKIEEKPEVRKAGGVYYTPQYIVEYIVKNTLGTLIAGKTPKEITKIKIVDPACGSGSFLIGAFQYLLDWHKNYYTDNGKISKGKKDNPLTPDGHLTTAEKKGILLNNIYGVDIDVNAVEVTKLSLLLKCMEGETSVSIAHQLSMFHERILPTLDNNIKSGNSLIDTDFYDRQLDFGDEKNTKPFNWQKGFPEVFNQGGFDVVIGNPPWVDLKGHPAEFKEYYFHKYHSTENRINLYAIFVERGIQFLNNNGKLGIIIPNSILYQSSYTKLRQLILKNHWLEKIVRLPDDTFIGVKAETVILILGNSSIKTQSIIYGRNDKISKIEASNALKTQVFDQNDWTLNTFSVFDIFSNEDVKNILIKIEHNKLKLIDLCDFSLGLTPYDKYKGHTQEQIENRVFHANTKINESFKPLFGGTDVTKYHIHWKGDEYISYGTWLSRPREKRFFTQPRILIRQIISGSPPRIYAAFTDQELYNTHSVFNLINKNAKEINLKFILGIINSTLMNFYHRNKYLDQSKTLFQKILIQDCKTFPIPNIDFKNKKEKTLYDDVIKNVDLLIMLNEERVETKLQTKLLQFESKIDYYEGRINEIVYRLYDLTEDEIKIIEGK